VNNSLIELGSDGSNLKVDLVVKIVKFVRRFFANIDNNIMKGRVPDCVPNFTPRNANSKTMNAVAPVAKIAALKVRPDALPPGTPAREHTGKSRKSNLLPRTSRKPVYSVARRELQSLNCSLMTSRRSCALSFHFTTKNAPS
jgi:hypothetical protein